VGLHLESEKKPQGTHHHCSRIKSRYFVSFLWYLLVRSQISLTPTSAGACGITRTVQLVNLDSKDFTCKYTLDYLDSLVTFMGQHPANFFFFFFAVVAIYNKKW
jgi:hypothetical protein